MRGWSTDVKTLWESANPSMKAMTTRRFGLAQDISRITMSDDSGAWKISLSLSILESRSLDHISISWCNCGVSGFWAGRLPKEKLVLSDRPLSGIMRLTIFLHSLGIVKHLSPQVQKLIKCALSSKVSRHLKGLCMIFVMPACTTPSFFQQNMLGFYHELENGRQSKV